MVRLGGIGGRKGARWGWGAVIFLGFNVRGQGFPDRWGSSSLLLSPSSTPYLFLISGKSYIAGQTTTSTPTDPTSLHLSLANPLSATSLRSPPWTAFGGATGPSSVYSSAIPIGQGRALIFGGDASGDDRFPTQSSNDSSFLLDVTIANRVPVARWTRLPAGDQPSRRQSSFSVSATDGLLTRIWLYGGYRADGSGAMYDELWSMEVPTNQTTTPREGWRISSGVGLRPPAMADGTAVMVTASDGSLRVVLVGGSQVDSTGASSLVDLGQIWMFTPSTRDGTWSRIVIRNPPLARRGHIAIAVDPTKIWIQGGRNLDGSEVYSDGAILDLNTRTWTPTAVGGSRAWGQVAQKIGEVVLIAGGYGINSPANGGMKIYSPSTDSWLDSYTPSYNIPPPISSARSSPSTGNDPIDPNSPLAVSPGALDPQATSDEPQWSIPGTPPQNIPSNPDSSTGSPSSTATGSTPGSPDDTTTSETPSPPISAAKQAKNNVVLVSAISSSLIFLLFLLFLLFVARRRRRRNNPQHSFSRFGDGATGRIVDPSGTGSLLPDRKEGEKGAYVIEQATALGRPMREVSGASRRASGTARKISGLWGGKKRGSREVAGDGEAFLLKRRSDMLDDEGEDFVGRDPKRGGWVQFASDVEQDDEEEDRRLNAMMVRGGRSGLGVWDGYGDRMDKGRNVSEGSYLGGALGGFSGMEGEDHEEKDWRMDRLEDWEGDAGSIVDYDLTPPPVERTPQRPPTELPGSSFSPPPSLSRAFSVTSTDSTFESSAIIGLDDPLRRRSSASSWWGRLNQLMPTNSTTPTSSIIRDTAPLPTTLYDIPESPSLHSLAIAVDPSAEPNRTTAPISTSGLNKEFGRMDPSPVSPGTTSSVSSSSGLALSHGRSFSSMRTARTATSDFLEERIREMDIVQRGSREVSLGSCIELEDGERREYSGSSTWERGETYLSSSSRPLRREEDDSNPFADPPPRSPTTTHFSTLAVRNAVTPSTSFDTISSGDQSGSQGGHSGISTNPTSNHSHSLHPLPNLPTTTKKSAVQALIEKIESRAPLPLPLPSPPLPTPSVSLPSFRGVVVSNAAELGLGSPSSSPVRERFDGKVVGGDGVRAHKLAKKPTLYVANP